MGRKPSSDSLLDWLALLQAPDIGSIHFHRLYRHCPDLGALLHKPDPALLDSLGLSAKTRKYLKKPDWTRAETSLRWAEGEHCHLLAFTDPEYPDRLRQIPGAPPILFVRGNPSVLITPQLAIVGSRNPSPGGQQNAMRFAEGLARAGLSITSGMATGIDACSHQGALQADGITIAVAGTGPDKIYPARHKTLARQIVQSGAIVSEFPPGTPALAANFPRRNRIISGLSLGTLVIEAALKSGSLITARLAVEQNREVFAIPGSIHNPLARGCHALLRQGAKLTEEIDDILDELAPVFTQDLTTPTRATKSSSIEASEMDAETRRLIASLGYEASSIDALVARSGLTPEVVSSMLVSLELQGRVSSTGGLYCRTD